MFDPKSAQQKPAVCCVPVSPMRREPAHRSEMVSQLLFGECCRIIEETTDHWVKVKSRYDGYEGWCQDSQVTAIEESVYESRISELTTDWISEITYGEQKMIVPMGCSFPGMKDGIAVWTKYEVLFNGQLVKTETVKRDEEHIRKFACQFLNTAYLWGGKSVFGIDCSGFTQSVYKFLGVPLLRDAYQQASQGNSVGFLQEVRCGDLAFFDNADGKITHVGIMLNDHEIIHSSGKVRIDRIDNQGIINGDTLARSHPLRIIKRYF